MKLCALITLVFTILVIQPADTPPRSESPTISSLSSSKTEISENVRLIAMIDSLQLGQIKLLPKIEDQMIRYYSNNKRRLLNVKETCEVFKDAQQKIDAIISSAPSNVANEKIFFDLLDASNMDKEENKIVYALYELHQFSHSPKIPSEHKTLYQNLARQASIQEIKTSYESTIGLHLDKIPSFDERYSNFCSLHLQPTQSVQNQANVAHPSDAVYPSTICPPCANDSCNTL